MKDLSYQKNINSYKLKEMLYLKVREKEGRVYSEDIIENLPEINKHHKFELEWKIRKDSAIKIVKYFRSFKNKKILDLGCGNCWLSNYINKNTDNEVFGLDLNLFELKQGAKVFRDSKLKLVYGNIFTDIFSSHIFDFIILSSTIQYFDNLKELLMRLSHFLAPNGEIHIFDSPIYNKDRIKTAINRTKEYYIKIGEPEMTNFYFHHSWEDLEKFNFKILNKKNFNLIKLFRKFSIVNPFPWIRITFN